MITIFSSHKAANNEGNKSNKISYWLKKLHKQEEKKAENEKKERFFEKQRPSLESFNSGDVEPAPQIKTKEESEKKGHQEAVKNHSRKINTDQRKLDSMVAKSNRILISISSMFPWDFFVSSINVEETRVTVIHRQFFATQVHSVNIKDISNVFIDTFLFFTTLTIISYTFEENNVKVLKLRKREADQVRRIIEGLRMFLAKDINTSRYTTKELIDKLEELSKTETVY
ncbi:MAG TPA: hypothetical protein VFD45_01930 [Patescibacteria group bacterium]|nr:hypothetical protein [Patescibacteria group bacterium]